MTSQQKSIASELLKSCARNLVSRHRFLVLQILTRMSPSRPVFQSLPLAELISILALLAVILVMISSVAILCWNAGWLVAILVLIAAFVFRDRIRVFGPGNPQIVIGLLLLLPHGVVGNETVGLPIRLGLCLLIFH